MATRATISLCSLLKSSSRGPTFVNSTRLSIRHLKTSTSCAGIQTQLPKAFFSDGSQLLSVWYRKLMWMRGCVRVYTTSSDGGDGGDGEKEDDEGSDSESEGSLGIELLPAAVQHAIAPVSIPENFPEVPMLAITRNPIFPRFVKMLEVSEHSTVCVPLGLNLWLSETN